MPDFSVTYNKKNRRPEYAVRKNGTASAMPMEMKGFEPSTFRMRTECSPAEPHPQNTILNIAPRGTNCKTELYTEAFKYTADDRLHHIQRHSDVLRMTGFTIYRGI